MVSFAKTSRLSLFIDFTVDKTVKKAYNEYNMQRFDKCYAGLKARSCILGLIATQYSK